MFKYCFLAVLTFLLFSFLVMNLWNHTVAIMFPWPKINFFQSAGLLLLTKILLLKVAPPCACRNHYTDLKNRFQKKNLEDKIADLTPEDRKKIKENLFKRCK